MNRDEFLNVFAQWLLSSGYASTKNQADGIAWSFVAGAWDGQDDLAEWADAYEELANLTSDDS